VESMRRGAVLSIVRRKEEGEERKKKKIKKAEKFSKPKNFGG
jgi:hypothetical protein